MYLQVSNWFCCVRRKSLCSARAHTAYACFWLGKPCLVACPVTVGSQHWFAYVESEQVVQLKRILKPLSITNMRSSYLPSSFMLCMPACMCKFHFDEANGCVCVCVRVTKLGLKLVVVLHSSLSLSAWRQLSGLFRLPAMELVRPRACLVISICCWSCNKTVNNNQQRQTTPQSSAPPHRNTGPTTTPQATVLAGLSWQASCQSGF